MRIKLGSYNDYCSAINQDVALHPGSNIKTTLMCTPCSSAAQSLKDSMCSNLIVFCCL